jgi:hypothetical protein
VRPYLEKSHHKKRAGGVVQGVGPDFKLQYWKKKKKKQARSQWLTPLILANWEAEIWRIMVQGQPRQTVHETPISKITRAKWTGGVTQAVEHLLCKHKTLSSNPSPTKKKKKKPQRG